MLVTNILTLVVLLILLTVVPMIPSLIMSRFLSDGLAVERAEVAGRI
ncbi:hypothetical protein ACVBEQ_26205 [Nakamurella sp. GG22]